MFSNCSKDYQYDKKGQLLSVADMEGNIAEAYKYDPAGNILNKNIAGKITTFTYDKANQLVTSTVDDKVTNYAYDAAGRLVKEGNKIYSYGYLDKILKVQENGEQIAAFDYHVGGQIASAVHGDKTENFLWDGLALIHRGDNSFVNEPYVTGGNPILSSKDGVMFNDMLGNTLGIKSSDGFNTVSMTAFGEPTTSQPNNSTTEIDKVGFFTGKPFIGELGYAFLFRNYRADQGKWQTKDPLGYPDGWNNLAYLNNGVVYDIDLFGAWSLMRWLYTGDGNASDYTYDASLAAAAETMGVQTAGTLSVALGQTVGDIVENGQGTLQLGLSGTTGGGVGATFGGGIALSYSSDIGWQVGAYSVGGGGSYIGAGGSIVVDVTLSANDSIYDLGGNAVTIGGSGSNNEFTIGGEVNAPLGANGATPSVTISVGTLVLPGTPGEAHVFLTNTQIFGQNEMADFLFRTIYE